MTNQDVDILKRAIGAVSEVLGETAWVADRLPPAESLAEAMPCVVMDLLPGDERHAWGGDDGSQLMDLLALDVEVVAGSRAEATPIAHLVRQVLHQLPFQHDSGVKSVKCPRFATREDISPHVRVLGTEVDLFIVA